MHILIQDHVMKVVLQKWYKTTDYYYKKATM
jgi:hypothetical protein